MGAEVKGLFFIWLVILNPNEGGVDIRVLKKPYATAKICVDEAVRIHDLLKKDHPLVRGAVCQTIDEFSEAKFPK